MGFVADTVKKLPDPLGLFSNNTPAVAPAPPAPSADKSVEVAAAQEEERRRRTSTGRASTVLTGKMATEPETATKKLLGA